MHTRVVIGVAAWLAGAGTATAGSLLAVSLLGQGMAAAPSQQLSVAAVNRALASEVAEAPHAALEPLPAASPGATTRPGKRRHHVSHHRKFAPAQPTGSLLTSAGGSVVAACPASGAYLRSWSPQQGFEATSVVRGPATQAQVTFVSPGTIVTMTVTCPQGLPAATTRVSSPGGGGGDE